MAFYVVVILLSASGILLTLKCYWISKLKSRNTRAAHLVTGFMAHIDNITKTAFFHFRSNAKIRNVTA